jgi:radical SAM protein (TIGR01212 family)
MKPSTNATGPASSLPCPMDWRQTGLRYFSYRHYLLTRFGGRVQKVSLDAGFTCPNVDGTVAVGGCTFCDNRSFSPSRRLPRVSIGEQLDEGIRRLKRRYDCDQFLAYFQPATNTYAPVDRLRTLYYSALEHPQVVGLVVGTRPDCAPDPVLDLLSELAGQTYVSVEYGLQTAHDWSLREMNRGHDYAAFVDAVRRSEGRPFQVCVHIMLGLPGETRQEMLETAERVAEQAVHAIKIHNLYIVRKTPLADRYLAGQLRLLDRDEYIEILIDVLERLPPRMVVERISGEAPSDYVLGPSWCLDKPALLRALDQRMAQRSAWQGKSYPCGTHGLDRQGPLPLSHPIPET